MERLTELRILAPCGILGYGYPKASFLRGMQAKPHAIVVDAGSTDAGPHKLGAGVAIVSRMACKKDLELMIVQGAAANIPVLIGSAGGSGGRVHVQWTWEIVKEILREHQLTELKVAIIWADIPKELIARRQDEGRVVALGAAVKELTPQRLEATNAVVAQMGHEPILKALEQGAQLIICGRAYDPSPFAAVAAHAGLPLDYGYHAGKILECAALCAEPGTTKDCMLGTIRQNSFTITPLSPERRCTPLSVAAHTFYEKDHPYLLNGPGYRLNLSQCSFTQEPDGCSTTVTGSRLEPGAQYFVKLEGAMQVAYRTFVIAGVRDPLMIAQLQEIEKLAENQVKSYYCDIPTDAYKIHFINYGLNGVMGELEPCTDLPHEVGVVMEVIAQTQELANSICGSLRSGLLHYGYDGRKSTAGNLAFPFAPSDVSFGPVYEFSVYHLMEVENPCELFPIEFVQVKEG